MDPGISWHYATKLVVNESSFHFSIQIGVLVQSVDQVLYVQAFADDILLWDVFTDRAQCPPSIQEALQIVGAWSEQPGLTFSVTKCKAIVITLMQNLEELQLQLLGTPMP